MQDTEVSRFIFTYDSADHIHFCSLPSVKETKPEKKTLSMSSLVTTRDLWLYVMDIWEFMPTELCPIIKNIAHGASQHVSLRRLLRGVFLPVGFPNSVSDGESVLWMTVTGHRIQHIFRRLPKAGHDGEQIPYVLIIMVGTRSWMPARPFVALLQDY